MLKRYLYLLAFGMLAGPAYPLVAATPLGAWKIEPSDARCVAVRQYGDQAHPTTLALKASAVDNAIQLAVIRPGFRSRINQSDATLLIDDRKVETSALSYPLAGKSKRVTHLISVDPEPAAALRSARMLTLEVKEGVKDSFSLEPSASLWRNVQDCVTRLRDVWNIGEDHTQRFSASARGDLQAMFSPEDYPVVAARNDQQGTTTFFILIDEKGRGRDCTVVGSSGSASLDSRSCGIILERGRFTPALGIDGKPIKTSFTRRITWRIQ